MSRAQPGPGAGRGAGALRCPAGVVRPPRRVLLLLAVLAGACAEPLAKLVPFPCAQDGTCPAGLACVPGVGCSFATLDALCGPGTDCGPSGGSCQLGLCAPPCERGCGAERVCSSAQGTGACLLDCSAGQACPENLTCAPLWHEGKKGCLPPAQAPRACAAVEPEAALVCGSASFTVQCPSGGRCAAHSVCKPNNLCECEPGYLAWQCQTAQSCSAASCAFPNWWCLPTGISGACATSGGWAPGTWRCADGRALAARCGTDCEAACREEGSVCDPVAQTCGIVGATKCTLYTTDAGKVDTTCVAPTGNVLAGSACARDAGAPYAFDDCTPGTLCSQIGEPGVLTCHPFCRHTSDCGSQACLRISDRVPPDGLCAKQCSLFAPCDGGRACGVDRDVDDRVVTQCRDQVPSAVLDTPCELQEDCAGGLLCLTVTGGAACKALCDGTHACPDAGPCAVFGRSELPAGTGFCR